jgi:hypothetical protein
MLFGSMIAMLIIGYLLGSEDADRAEELAEEREWHRHVQSALFVARRTL